MVSIIIVTCTLLSGRFILLATSSLIKISGYFVLAKSSSRISSWPLVKVVRSRRCFRGGPTGEKKCTFNMCLGTQTHLVRKNEELRCSKKLLALKYSNPLASVFANSRTFFFFFWQVKNGLKTVNVNLVCSFCRQIISPRKLEFWVHFPFK